MLASNRNEENKSKKNKPVYLDFSRLENSKALIYELWHEYIKPKYQQKAKLCNRKVR